MQKRLRAISLIILTLLFLVNCVGEDSVENGRLSSPATFDALNTAIDQGEYGNINSMLIWQGEQLHFEGYYRGTDADTMNQVYSVTKSVTSAMIGKAVSQQAMQVEDPMLEYFPDYAQIENMDVEKEAMTVEDLLTMQAGFPWDEVSSSYGSSTNSLTGLIPSRDWMKFMIDQPIAFEPGTTFAYNSGVSMLLGGILQEVTGQTAEMYTAENLFAPLGIEEWRWESTPRGYSNTGWGLYLRPVDLLKFGQLYLQNGEWEGEQILASSWIAESTQPSALPGDGFEYGYQWWRFEDDHPVVADLAVNDVYFAWGLGGNFVFVVPHLDLVVVTTAENDSGPRIFPALPDYIFPEFSQ